MNFFHLSKQMILNALSYIRSLLIVMVVFVRITLCLIAASFCGFPDQQRGPESLGKTYSPDEYENSSGKIEEDIKLVLESNLRKIKKKLLTDDYKTKEDLVQDTIGPQISGPEVFPTKIQAAKIKDKDNRDSVNPTVKETQLKSTTIEPPGGHYVPATTGAPNYNNRMEYYAPDLTKLFDRNTSRAHLEHSKQEQRLTISVDIKLGVHQIFEELGKGSDVNITATNSENWNITKGTNLQALILVNIVLSIFCVGLSGTMMYFRIKTGSTKSLVNILYLKNGLADFFVGMGVLSQSPVLYLMISKGRDISGITVPVFISYFVTAVAVKMSVFLNCVLGVVRCINIVNPFYKPNKKVITASTLLYMIVCVLIVGLDIWQFTEKRETDNKVFLVKSFVLKGQPGFGLVLLTMDKDQYRSSYLAYHLGNLIQFILPTALPTLLCFVLMIVQLYHMPKKNLSKLLKKTENGNDSTTKASLTIFLLTCIYVFTSGASVITWLIIHGRNGYFVSQSKYEILMEEKRRATSWSDLIAIYFSFSTCPLICSTLTPLTLLLRGTGPAISGVRKIFTRSSSGTADTTF